MSKLFRNHFKQEIFRPRNPIWTIHDIDFVSIIWSCTELLKIYQMLQEKKNSEFSQALSYQSAYWRILEEFYSPKCKILIGEVLKHQITPFRAFDFIFIGLFQLLQSEFFYPRYNLSILCWSSPFQQVENAEMFQFKSKWYGMNRLFNISDISECLLLRG